MTIHKMNPENWPQVREIYEEGIATKMATFETSAGTWEKWDQGHLADPRLVMTEGDVLLGWAALSPVSGRCVYGGVAEVSVYIRSSAKGRGIGTRLLEELIRQSDESGIWTLQAGIFADNHPSIKLHEKVGFRIVGTREKLGQLDGVWRDIVLMERRSDVVGV
ncbi:MAG: N-acetyltransferase family protein [Balneolaceae bacterium]|nr:MAG: N-acetyltransferase family protein [Balneolaceae bacterium]